MVPRIECERPGEAWLVDGAPMVSVQPNLHRRGPAAFAFAGSR